ncbi:lipopolysaccharide biosynthesis protein [Priestia megaterium]
MRTEQSIKNIFISIFSQLIIVALGFISRKVFLDSLGVNYLGVNGLLTNVLSMMALVEGGIGLSIVYNLYKPLAESDRKKVIALVQLYKKVYKILALITLLISLCLYPFLEHLMKEGESISNITIIYFLFVAKNIVSYLNAHKWSLINADQRGYVLVRMELFFQVTTTVAKILVLIATENYILYLLIEFFIYIIQNITNGIIVNKRYSYIKTKTKHSIDNDTKENLKKNVKALFLHNIGGFCVFGTDNILISSFVSIATVGLYSNYTMITQQLASLISPLLGGIGASVGNLIATESNEKNYSVFKIAYLMNFWIYSFSLIFLYNLLEPFINWWLGDGYLLDNVAFIFILINFYLNGMRTAISTFKNKAGLFVQDKYAPLFEGLINLVFSLVLVKYLGLTGIFLGTAISTLSTVFWTQPVIVYKNVFKRSVWSYFKSYSFYALLTIGTCFITTIACNNFVEGGNFISLLLKGIICLVIPNSIYVIVFFKTAEFQYLTNILKSNLFKLRRKRQIIKGV